MCGTAIALSEIAAEIVYQDVAALSRAFKLLMMWLMVAHPLIFGVALTISVMLSAALAWALWRFLRAGLRRLQQWRAPVAATP